jgi:hypothetical protein
MVWSGLDGVRSKFDERGRECPLYTVPLRERRGVEGRGAVFYYEERRKQEAKWVWLVYSEKPQRLWLVYSVFQSIEVSRVNDPSWSHID